MVRKTLGGIFLVFVSAVIILPNVVRSKGIFDPITGASTVRIINTAQVAYATNYDKIGYAPTLAVLGPAGNAACGPEHACLLDIKLACPEGAGRGWCTYYGYRYNVQTNSTEPPYRNYWVTATPVQPDSKLGNFCSTADAVVRFDKSAPLSRPYTFEECEGLPKVD
ncbi:MAG TPA: hypothetical protein VIB39_15195 [Candidatus Angelobacter sp.]